MQNAFQGADKSEKNAEKRAYREEDNVSVASGRYRSIMFGLLSEMILGRVCRKPYSSIQ